MPDKNNEGADQGLDSIKSRSAQSGPPDDKERDSTQRGDQGEHDGQLTQGGNRRTPEEEGESAKRSDAK